MSFRKIERESYKGYRICRDPESEYYWVEPLPGNTDTWGGIYETEEDVKEAIDERLQYRVPPKDLYDYIREHQAATDASDEDLLRILCGFIALIDDTEGLPIDLGEYIVQHLERAPGDIACNHNWVEGTDDDGMLVEPAFDVCSNCGMRKS